MANSSDIGSDVEVTDKDVLDLKSEAEAVVFGGSWFSVVKPDTFQLPSPIFLERMPDLITLTVICQLCFFS